MTVAAVFCVLLALAPAASAATGAAGGLAVPVAFLGLPSLHSIIEGIAKGFFSVLAGALVPGFLKHGTVAIIQHLVALPDPATWPHVSELEGDMTYLGMSLMPVTLTVCALRYWMAGLTGAAHPATAIGRCAGATGVLVIYRWIVEQTVAGTNTLTHAILGFPVVANGLASIITVLFGGALLVGAGGVFGAFLVMVGVVFAASLFASKVALTFLLAFMFCVGPPFIALAPIPELSQLARAWAHALMAIVLVPLGWTMLFAVAGALTLDATSFTSAPGVPGRIEAAFAGLITFVIAVKLPLMLFGELRNILGGASLRGGGSSDAQGQATMPGAERMRAAHARLRSVGLEGLPSLGRSTGRAAGALGAPAGGAAGATRRGLVDAAARTGVLSRVAPATAASRTRARLASERTGGANASRPGVRERLTRARRILADSPREARAAMNGVPLGVRDALRTNKGTASFPSGARAARRTTRQSTVSNGAPPQPRSRTRPKASAQIPASPTAQPQRGSGVGENRTHPGKQVIGRAERDANVRTPGQERPARPASKPGPREKPPEATPAPTPRAARRDQPLRRKRRPKGGGR